MDSVVVVFGVVGTVAVIIMIPGLGFGWFPLSLRLCLALSHFRAQVG